MRYIADTDGYVKQVSFGADILCGDDTCTEYVGAVPTGYVSLEAWFLEEAEKLYRWKIVDDNLTLDSTAVAPCDKTPEEILADLGGVSIKKLWGNGNLDAQFAAQTVTVDWTIYDRIGYEYQYSDTVKELTYNEIPAELGNVGAMQHTYLSTSRVPQFGERNMTLVSGGIKFSGSYVGLASGNAAASNWYCIPVAIYGITGVK